MGAPLHWTREQVDQNVLGRHTLDGPPEYRPFDIRSVMLQPFDGDLFHEPVAIPVNTELSPSDREFIRHLYPRARTGLVGCQKSVADR